MELDWERIDEEVRKEEERLEKEVKQHEKQVEKLEKEKYEVEKMMEKATEELKRRIKEIEKPYIRKIDSIEKQVDKINNKIYDLKHLLNTARDRVVARFDRGEEFLTAEAFKEFMRKHGIYLQNVVKINKKLPNGITLFRQYDDPEVAVSYYAVKGRKIVGYHFTRKAQHRGDEATPYAWINKRLLRENNQEMKEYTTGYYYKHKLPLKFRDWKEKVGKIKKFIAIDLKDKINKKVLAEDWYVRWGRYEEED